MARTTWVYDPHSGGTKIPDRAKDRIRLRILKHAEANYAGKYFRIEVRFRAQFCYIDAYTELNYPMTMIRSCSEYPEMNTSNGCVT